MESYWIYTIVSFFHFFFHKCGREVGCFLFFFFLFLLSAGVRINLCLRYASYYSYARSIFPPSLFVLRAGVRINLCLRNAFRYSWWKTRSRPSARNKTRPCDVRSCRKNAPLPAPNTSCALCPRMPIWKEWAFPGALALSATWFVSICYCYCYCYYYFFIIVIIIIIIIVVVVVIYIII